MALLILAPNHVAAREDSWSDAKSAGGAAVSEQAGFEASKLAGPDRAGAWKSNGVTTDVSRAEIRFAEDRQVDAVSIKVPNATDGASVRLVAGKPSEFRAVKLGPPASENITSAATASTSTDRTVVFCYRVSTKDITGPAKASPVDDTHISFNNGTDSAPNRDWRLGLDTDGKLSLLCSRYGGTEVEIVSTDRIDDGELIWGAFVLDNSGPTLELFLRTSATALTSQGTAIPPAASAQPLQQVEVFGVDLVRLWIMDAVLTQAQLEALFDGTLTAQHEGADANKSVIWNMDESDYGTGTVTAAIGPNGTITTSPANAWTTILNPWAGDSGILPLWQYPTRRQIVTFDGSTGSYAQTAATCVATPHTAGYGWVGVPSWADSGSRRWAFMMGNTFGTRDYGLSIEATGAARFWAPRTAGGTESVTGSGVRDGLLHFYFWQIDAIGPTLYFWIDNTSQGSVTVPAFTAASNMRLVLGGIETHGATAQLPCDFGGDFVIVDYPMTAAEAWSRRFDIRPPEHDPRVQHHFDFRQTSGAITNRGVQAKDLTLTGATRTAGGWEPSQSGVNDLMPGILSDYPAETAAVFSTAKTASTLTAQIFDPDNGDDGILVAELGAWQAAVRSSQDAMQISKSVQRAARARGRRGYAGHQAEKPLRELSFLCYLTNEDSDALGWLMESGRECLVSVTGSNTARERVSETLRGRIEVSPATEFYAVGADTYRWNSRVTVLEEP